MPLRWTAEDIRFDLVREVTDHPVVTIAIDTPAGRLRLMAVPEWTGDRVLLRRAHVQADAGLGPNSLGLAGLRHLARLVMEKAHVRELVIVGEIRTTGA